MRFSWGTLILSALLTVTIVQGLDYRRPTKVLTKCCKRVSNATIPKITAYREQMAFSPCVEAVVLYSDKKQFCTDPRAPWLPESLKGVPKIS
uniref:Chemokine interleukin-8-like domain-containing protein n=1 Tax=Denticeps clupeoides TaxID=299321 RepID=A0AAY3ZZG4_9TELE